MPSNESHKDKEGWPEMLLGAGSEPRSGKEKLSVLRVEGTLLVGGSGQCCFACAGRGVGRVFARGRDKLILSGSL